MSEISFQGIFNIIQPTLPSNWKKLILFIAFSEGTCDIKYFISNDENKYVDCFQLGIDHNILLSILVQINDEAGNLWKQLPEKDRWSNMTLCIESNGLFNTEYDYSEMKEPTDIYYDEWRKKYLI